MVQTKKSFDDIVMDFIAYTIVTIFAFMTLYPFINILAVSISDYSAYVVNPMLILPKGINFKAYELVFNNPLIKNCYFNTIFITVVGVIIGLILTALTAYPLSKKQLKGKGIFMSYIIFTMLFNGGIIPNFYLIRTIGLLDSLWALILPGAVSAFNVILMKNFFESIPESLEESAKIDGASYPKIFTEIILPLSKPILSTIGIFLAVMYWNSFFSAVLYIRSNEKWPLQLLLRETIASTRALMEAMEGNNAELRAENMYPTTLQYATLIVSVMPILCVYPFLQQYFVKGVMIGAVKG